MVLARMLDRCRVPFGVAMAGAKDVDILREGVADMFTNLGRRAFRGRLHLLVSWLLVKFYILRASPMLRYRHVVVRTHYY